MTRLDNWWEVVLNIDRVRLLLFPICISVILINFPKSIKLITFLIFSCLFLTLIMYYVSDFNLFYWRLFFIQNFFQFKLMKLMKLMSVCYFIHSTFLMGFRESLMFCSFSNIFSQSFIVRLFRLTIVFSWYIISLDRI